MAPTMKRKAGFASRAGKRAKSSELSLVVSTIGGSEAVPENLRALLTHTLPIVLAANKVDRHEYESEVVKQAEQALKAVQASLEVAHKDALAAQNAVIAPAEAKKRAQAKKDAEASLEAAKTKLANDKVSKKDAETAVSAAEEALKVAKKAEADADKVLQRFVKKQASLVDALAKEFELVQNNASSCAGGKEAVKTLKTLGKEFGLDNTLLETLPISCKKAPDTRSEFESMVFSSLKSLINGQISALGKEVAGAEPIKAEKSAATANALATLEHAKATLKAATDTLNETHTANTEGAKAVRKADHHLRGIWEDMRQACDAQDKAAAAVQNVKENVTAAFVKLREKEPEPEPVEPEPAPVEEEAAPAEPPAEAAA